MEFIGQIMFYLGWVIAFIGGIMTLIGAFSSGFLWGIGALLFSPVGFIWIITHWEEGKTPFLTSVAGGVLIFIGAVMSGL